MDQIYKIVALGRFGEPEEAGYVTGALEDIEVFLNEKRIYNATLVPIDVVNASLPQRELGILASLERKLNDLKETGIAEFVRGAR